MQTKIPEKYRPLFESYQAKITKRFEVKQFCFDEQLAFIQDESTLKTAVCSRRAGKTVACAADLIDTALNHANVVCLYITLSRKNAKRIIWPELLRINTEYNLGGNPNETDLSLKFPNDSIIYCSGAKDKSEIENYRGMAMKKVYIDEVQSFRNYIQDLVDDVISKALFDHNGTLCLIGTPGLIPKGYFYECSHSQRYSKHSWTMFQNPFLEKKSGKKVIELVQQDCERMGVEITHPKIQRECYGRWVVDTESLIFQYDANKNHYEHLPALDGKWEYVIGVDIGHDDADAIAVIGWHPRIKEAYLVEELVKAKQGITELADQLDKFIKTYDPLRVVMDTGGLGKKIAEELKMRRDLPIEPAQKTEKMAHIEILNDAMRTQKFYAKKDSQFAQDCFLVEKDVDKSRVDKIIISDKYHSDVCDSVIYSYRCALNWLHEPEKPKIKPQSDEWFQKQAEEMEEVLLKQLNQSKEDDIWGDSEWYS